MQFMQCLWYSLEQLVKGEGRCKLLTTMSGVFSGMLSSILL